MARRSAARNNAPPCMWSPSPPLELKGAPAQALSVNAGFVTFVILPRHVEGRKLDRTVGNLSTFHAYGRYHVKIMVGAAAAVVLAVSLWRYSQSTRSLGGILLAGLS